MEFDSMIAELSYQPVEDIFLEEDIVEFDDYALDYSYEVEYA
jgi:hypothetical protein